MPRLILRPMPTSTAEMRGLRYAAWLRESTEGQFDRFGPEAQRSAIQRAADELGLIDSGLNWSVSGSGKTVHADKHFRAMIASAQAGGYDILLCAYVSRLARNLWMFLTAIHGDLHPAGVAVYFADERLLSSNPRDQDQLEREAQEAGAYSRKLGRRIGEGLAAKRARGEPGGRPPFGFRREGNPPSLVPVPERMEVLQRAYALSASGLTDGEVAARTGLKKTHVAEILTNPIYVGQLRDGSHRQPVVDRTTWESVQARRRTYARRHPGSSRRRTYILGALLHCRHCGRMLTGHTDRYRHVGACLAFKAARPRPVRAYSNAVDRRIKGESYPVEVYESPLAEVLGRLAVNASLLIEVEEAVERLQPAVDELGLGRIRTAREEALKRLGRDRDSRAWHLVL